MARTSVGTNNVVLTVDETQLVGIQMVNYPVEKRGVILIYAVGYSTDGVFKAVENKNLKVEASEFAAFATSTPDLAGSGFFAALKDWCYEQIQLDANS